MGDVFGQAEAAGRNGLRDPLALLDGDRVQQRSVDGAGGDGVGGDAVLGQFDGEGAGQADHAALGRRVVGLAETA
ncbi:hypothetical protein D3C78_1571700 [compost metagenome]